MTSDATSSSAPPPSGGPTPRVRVAGAGRTSVDWMIELPVGRGCDRRVKYQADVFFFVPAALGLTPERYDAEQFFRHLDTAFQFVPASMRLARILDENNDASPLTRLGRLVKSDDPACDAAAAVYEFRTLANVVAAQADRWRGALAEAEWRVVDVSTDRFTEFVDAGRRLLDRLRALGRDRFQGGAWPSSVVHASRWADELSSLSLEQAWLSYLARRPETPEAKALRRRIREEALHEAAYRRARGYAASFDPGRPESAGRFMRRREALLDWARAATVLESRASPMLARLREFLYAVAAAVAMAFAVMVTIFAQRRYAFDSLPFILIAVASYMLKDRIKDAGRLFFLRWIPRFVADDVRRFVDPATGEVVGRLRARLRRPAWANVPEVYRAVRDADPLLTEIAAARVLHYQCEITLDTARLNRAHTRLDRMVQRCRLSLEPWLPVIDETRRPLRYIADHRMRPASVRVASSYRVDVATSAHGVAGRREGRRPVSPRAVAVRFESDEMDIQFGDERIVRLPPPPGAPSTLAYWRFTLGRRGVRRQRPEPPPPSDLAE